MEITLQIVFWCATFLVIYTYALYPFILLVGRKQKKAARVSVSDAHLPTVTVVIAVFNEEDHLRKRLANLASIDYPRERLTVLIGSDGSTDGTNKLLEEQGSVFLKPFLFSKRRGKALVLNDLIEQAEGEIVVLSDANTLYDTSAIKNLVKHFADPIVGAVCGELVLESNNRTVGGLGESSYWRYENIVKKLESDFYTTLGTTGAIYGLRKALFVPLPASKPVTDDFVIAMSVLQRHYRIVYEPSALAYEHPANSVVGEFRRKVRIGASNFHGISEYASLLSPRFGIVAFELWSHKIIRWFVPFFILVLTLSCLVLAGTSPFFRYLLTMEGVFFLTALLGLLCEVMKIQIGILGLPYYFVAMNTALFVGFFKFLRRSQGTAWEVVR